MRRLYVAGQNEATREWVPVAELREVQDGFELRYTNGAQRLPGFGGFGRMQALDKVYFSPTLFPFFSNRLLSRSRPEYQSYMRWLGLDGVSGDAMDILSVTGGVRATDSFELVATPRVDGTQLELDFFPRGLRHLDGAFLAKMAEIAEGDPLFLMKDIQNDKDAHAIALRAEKPSARFIGYVPRYYCAGVTRLLDQDCTAVTATVKRVNPDAPQDMKLLVTLRAKLPANFELLKDVHDFRPLTSLHIERSSEDALSRTDLTL